MRDAKLLLSHSCALIPQRATKWNFHHLIFSNTRFEQTWWCWFFSQFFFVTTCECMKLLDVFASRVQALLQRISCLFWISFHLRCLTTCWSSANGFGFEQKYGLLHRFYNKLLFLFGVICGIMNEKDYFQFHVYCIKINTHQDISTGKSKWREFKQLL